MEFGLFSLSARDLAIARDAWNEDLWEFQLAEELGFTEGWVAEHPGGIRPDALSSADQFICKVAALTSRMRFGPGVRPLPHYHPVHVATQAAVSDHLTDGRYMAGFGGARATPPLAGGVAYDHLRQLGIEASPSDKRAMMFEAIELIVKCWTEREPFDYHGRFWHGERIKIEPKPLQQPHMPVGIANSESPVTARFAGEHGFWPLHFYYDTGPQLAELSSAFEDGARAAGRLATRKDIRVCRFVHVADTDRLARDEARGVMEENLRRQKRGPALAHVVRSLPPGGSVDQVTFDYLVDSGIFLVGNPETVLRQTLDFYEAMQGFGVLLFAVGNSFGTRGQRERSWRMFMKEIAPALAALDPDRARVPLEESASA